MKNIYIVLLVLLIGCTSQGLKRRKLNDYYLNSGVTRYFLPETPSWTNRSAFSSCLRSENAKFLNFKAVSQSFEMKFEEVLQLQLLVNQDIQELKSRNHVTSLNLKEEEKIFFKAIEKVQAGILGFKQPTYKRVNLYLVDDLINQQKPMKSILSNSDFLESGHPVIVSFCQNNTQLYETLKKNNLLQSNIKILPFEALTAFDKNFKLTPQDVLHLDGIFRSNQQLYVYGMKNKKITKEIIGKYKRR